MAPLELVQLRFLHIASHILYILCPSHGYSSIVDVCGLPSLTEGRYAAYYRFIEGLLNGKVK